MKEEIILSYDWYKTAQTLDSLRKESSLKDIFTSIPMWLSVALVAILSGSAIQNTVEKYNLSQEQKNQLEYTVKNKAIMDRLQEGYETYKKTHTYLPAKYTQLPKGLPIEEPSVRKDTSSLPTTTSPKSHRQDAEQQKIEVKLPIVVKHMVDHEGLVPHQTPFKITNPEMRKWTRIMGFPVNKHPKAPRDRRNFFYLKNHQDVIPAVTKLLESYANNPEKYNLPDNPTLRQAIRKFDQTNATHKIRYLKEQIPDLDLDRPLSDFL